MKLWILIIVLPAFTIINAILVYILFVDLNNIFLGFTFCIISILVGLTIFKIGIHTSQSHFKNISKSTVDIQKIEVTFSDGIKSVGNIYRSLSDTILTPNGRRYPEPRPVVIFFHGFWKKKEINEKYLIFLAHMGYVTTAFDQRGHGEAGGKRNDWYELYNDVDKILDTVCSFEDGREGSICCIGKSMGGTSVLTKCYQDERVAMVIGISALHDVELLLKAKFRFLSSGWFIRRIMSKVKDKRALKICAHYFLKNDPEYNKNRVFLIHGKYDKIFPPSLTFKPNKEQAGIPEDHAFLLNNCGHNFAGQETLVFGIIFKWILENKVMKLKV